MNKLGKCKVKVSETCLYSIIASVFSTWATLLCHKEDCKPCKSYPFYFAVYALKGASVTLIACAVNMSWVLDVVILFLVVVP